jgi:hypothetical protein
MHKQKNNDAWAKEYPGQEENSIYLDLMDEDDWIRKYCNDDTKYENVKKIRLYANQIGQTTDLIEIRNNYFPNCLNIYIHSKKVEQQPEEDSWHYDEFSNDRDHMEALKKKYKSTEVYDGCMISYVYGDKHYNRALSQFNSEKIEEKKKARRDASRLAIQQLTVFSIFLSPIMIISLTGQNKLTFPEKVVGLRLSQLHTWEKYTALLSMVAVVSFLTFFLVAVFKRMTQQESWYAECGKLFLYFGGLLGTIGAGAMFGAFIGNVLTLENIFAPSQHATSMQSIHLGAAYGTISMTAAIIVVFFLKCMCCCCSSQQEDTEKKQDEEISTNSNITLTNSNND